MITQERPKEFFMLEAFKEAQNAAKKGEVPVGAVIVCNNKIIARSYNQTEQLKDVTAHAEMVAITSAANHLANKYLHDCEIYVTLEPCPMCAAALHWAQVKKVYYGAQDPKKGYTKISAQLLHPKTIVEAGIMKEQCGKIITDFFERLRP